MQQNTINSTHNKGDFRFLYICHVKKLKLIHLWKIFSFLHMFHVQKFEISPHDRFFLHGHRPCVRDKYEVWCTFMSAAMSAAMSATMSATAMSSRRFMRS